MCDSRKCGDNLSEANTLRPKYLTGLSTDEWRQWLDLISSKGRDHKSFGHSSLVRVTLNSVLVL